MIALLSFLSAFLLSYGATAALLRLRPRGGFVDIPNERSSHETPKPRFGGIAIVAAFGATVLVLCFFDTAMRAWLPLLLGGGALFATGLIDDWRPLSVTERFAVQFAAAGVAIVFGNVIDHVYMPMVGSIGLSWFSVPATVLFIMACVNFYNFIDGIDGLAAGSAFIASLFLALISMILGHASLGILYLVAAGSAVGFLQFNFPPSRLFMGDSGSTFLGYVFAYVAIAGNRLTPELPVFIPLLILSSLYLDAGLTLLGRLFRGEKVLQAHHTHYYQRLLSLGLNHKQVTLLEYFFTVLLGVSAVVYFEASSYFTLFLSVCWLAVFTAAILKIRGLERGDRLFWERRTLFVVGTDVVLIVLAYVGAYFLRMNFRFTEAEGMAMLKAMPIVLVVRTAVFFKYGLYRGVWKYTSVPDVVRVIKAVTTGSVIILTAVFLLYRFVAFPRTLFVIEYFLLITLILGARFSLRLFHEIGKEAHDAQAKRYAIIGAGDYGERLAREIKNREGPGAVIACYLDDDPSKVGLLLHGAPVVGPVSRAPEVCLEYGVDVVAIGIRRTAGASMAAVVRSAQACGLPLAGASGETAVEREPAPLAFARLSRRLGRRPIELTDRAQRALDGRRVLITHAASGIGTALAGELARLGASVAVQFDTARERDLVGPAGAVDGLETRLGPIDGVKEAAELVASVNPEVAVHIVSIEAGGEDEEAFLWRHVVRSSDAITGALARTPLHRFVLVTLWGDRDGGSSAAAMAALAEACMLGSSLFARVPAAALRLPRVLTASDLLRSARSSDEATYDLTEVEAVAHAVNVAAESSRGIFVTSRKGSIAPGDLRWSLAGADDAGGAEGLERQGPLFPSEQLHASALESLRRVSGPLYPASDVFRRLVSTAPVGSDPGEREEWLRVIAGQLYHIVPAGLGSDA